MQHNSRHFLMNFKLGMLINEDISILNMLSLFLLTKGYNCRPMVNNLSVFITRPSG